ncbi:MAG TPA: peptidase M28 family protein [Flavobacteriales bacterium]|nr:peptidase M28 family protein [Crocinitomicaceae bacterium]HCC64038.1 peptidase M28 family protein [Flavobacteriales bacterium]
MISIEAGIQASAQTSTNSSDSLLIRQVFDEVLSHGEAHENLRVLCKDIGHRLSGSPSADRAMVWGQQRMDSYGVDTSYVMPVEVPAWTRGDVAEAQALSADGIAIDLHITALGGSVPTPDDGWIEGPLLVVRQLDALDTLDARGHIVLFNRPMDPLLINTGAAYGGAFDQRGGGASAAAEAGAIGVLVRSLTHALDTLPHTGSLRYKDGVDKLPAAAISTVDASALAKLHREEPGTVQVKMRLNSQDLGTVEQGNVVGEWRGSEFPDEIITLGGHLDSWDIGEGAHDDGSGVVHTLEALRALKAIGYTPRRTLRFVLFINEENGNRGGKRYAAVATEEHDSGLRHVAAMESDAGGFVPRGVRMDAPDEGVAMVRGWAETLEPYNLHYFGRGGAGVDIGPLKNLEPRPLLMGLVPDGQRYFDLHHSSQDVWENVHKRELELGAATCASMVLMLDRHAE